MHTRDQELEDFKTNIDLALYAESLGYAHDPKDSSPNSVCMKHPNADKIFIGMGQDNHWVFWSAKNPDAHGSIIDLVQKRKGLNLGRVRKELRPWLNRRVYPSSSAHSPTPAAHRSTTAPKPQPVKKDIPAVQARYNAAKNITGRHPFLCNERSLSEALWVSDRFSGRMRENVHGDVLFAHWNRDGICGYEMKNVNLTRFSSGGEKGLWGSKKKDSDTALAIAETALDAMSYAQLFGYERTRFVSIAGQMSPQQPALLNLAIQKMPTGSTIIAAVDNDDGGSAIAHAIEAIVRHVINVLGRDDLTFTVDMPKDSSMDWNDMLRSGPPQPCGGGRPELSA